MKVLKIIGIILLVLVALIAILGVIAPKDYSVERSVIINAPAQLVFNHAKYWRNWQAWSPWAEMDSTMKATVEGIDGAAGSIYKWSGEKVGTGEMTNTGIKEKEEIAYHLRFLKPWESESDGYVRLADVEGNTEASWGFYGKNPFPWNVMTLFMSMDKMMGKDFNRGLSLLKDISEKEYASIQSYSVKEINFPARTYAAIQKVVAFDQMQGFFAESYATIMAEMGKKGIKMAGAPCALYYEWDEQNNTTNVAAAIPIKNAAKLGDLNIIQLPATTAFMVDYFGSYQKSAPAHYACDLYLSNKGLKQKSPIIEEYITDPTTEPDSSKWLTKIYYFGE
ncbi:MAG TPA: SRPBCC family protein [bacterium]